MAPGFGPINPLAGTKPIQPIQPIMPTPAVTASPAMPATPTVGRVVPPPGGIALDPNARARVLQPLTNLWGGVTGGLATGMGYLGDLGAAVSPVQPLSQDFYDWVDQREVPQYGIQPGVNFPNAPSLWRTQQR